MTDPLRRDPTEFLRGVKRMANNSSWQKALLFASRGRMIGFKLGIEHYNAILFSQCLWGRALEIVKTIRSMQEDEVRPNGVSYYYICNGLANADHGMNHGYNMNFKLEGLQHWRVATEALMACEHNGYDPSDTMYNSCIITCTIPVMNHWKHATALFHKMCEDERNPHPQMIEFFVQCLIRNKRPREATALLRYAKENGVKGYSGGDGNNDSTLLFASSGATTAASATAPAVFTPAVSAFDHRHRSLETSVNGKNQFNSGSDDFVDVFAHLPNFEKDENDNNNNSKMKNDSMRRKIQEGEDQKLVPELDKLLEEETEKEIAAEDELEALRPQTGGTHADAKREFRPRVYRGMWYKWNAVANRYRPTAALTRRQIAPRNSPTGIPGFNRL